MATLEAMADDVRNIHDALSTIAEHWQPHRLTSVSTGDAGGEMTSELQELG